MRRIVLCGVVGLFLSLAPARAADAPGKVVKEVWDAAYFEGHKVGFVHTTVREVEKDGRKLYATSMELDLTIRRYKAVARLGMETGTIETADGKVVGVFMRQFDYTGGARKTRVSLTGTVTETGKQLHTRTADGRIDKNVPWDPEVIGLYRQERLFQDRKAKPGDTFTYRSYEPTLNAVLTISAAIKDKEEVDVLRPAKGGPKGKVVRAKEQLLRVETAPEELRVGDKSVRLPGMVAWLDRDLMTVRSQMELPPLGNLTLYRTTREVATAAGDPAGPVVDLGRASLIRLSAGIPNPHATRSAVYRVTVKGDRDVATALARDARQQVRNVDGDTFELHVKAVRAPRPKEDPGEPPADCLKSCYYLDSDDPRVRELARDAVGSETDPWRKAQRIERFVHNRMRGDNGVDFCKASDVARSLRGDCRQHAMLTAAMCRAAGVPSRLAIGLVYVNDREKGPVMGFHMWTEVWVKGQWLDLDATLGQGSIGAAHIKVSADSWHDAQSLTPLLPLQRVLGKMSIEVVSVNKE
ncbi:MAG TPA: transglutaminase domain-containing protein [Gemmataceae bacterium]|nr:transglutaminase domain-containing protein [Gemmataceae bacterium]